MVKETTFLYIKLKESPKHRHKCDVRMRKIVNQLLKRKMSNCETATCQQVSHFVTLFLEGGINKVIISLPKSHKRSMKDGDGDCLRS